MQLTDQRDIKADPAIVWAAILNPEVLKECVPGCESMSGSAESGFEAVVVQKVGPVKARFTGVVQLSDIVEGRSLRISGEGKGGPAGFAKGGANVTLTPSRAARGLAMRSRRASAASSRSLARRSIDGFAKKMADDFFERFQQAVEGPDEGEATSGEDAAEMALRRRAGSSGSSAEPCCETRDIPREE